MFNFKQPKTKNEELVNMLFKQAAKKTMYLYGGTKWQHKEQTQLKNYLTKLRGEKDGDTMTEDDSKGLLQYSLDDITKFSDRKKTSRRPTRYIISLCLCC